MFLSAANTGYSCEVILPNAARSGNALSLNIMTMLITLSLHLLLILVRERARCLNWAVA
jgi:hypothetical protein